jgi:hypothetical protein
MDSGAPREVNWSSGRDDDGYGNTMTGLRKRVGKWPCRVLAAAVLFAGSGFAAGTEASVEKIKAAFLYNFAKYVVWPEEKFRHAQAPIVLCVLEPDPLGAVLEQTVAGRAIGGRPVVVRRSADATALRACHLLYAGDREPRQLEAAFAQVAGAAVMTVHNADHPLVGGVARFYVQDQKLRFEINAASAERAGVQLSAKLQSLATIVRR